MHSVTKAALAEAGVPQESERDAETRRQALHLLTLVARGVGIDAVCRELRLARAQLTEMVQVAAGRRIAEDRHTFNSNTRWDDPPRPLLHVVPYLAGQEFLMLAMSGAQPKLVGALLPSLKAARGIREACVRRGAVLCKPCSERGVCLTREKARALLAGGWPGSLSAHAALWVGLAQEEHPVMAKAIVEWLHHEDGPDPLDFVPESAPAAPTVVEEESAAAPEAPLLRMVAIPPVPLAPGQDGEDVPRFASVPAREHDAALAALEQRHNGVMVDMAAAVLSRDKALAEVEKLQTRLSRGGELVAEERKRVADLTTKLTRATEEAETARRAEANLREALAAAVRREATAEKKAATAYEDATAMLAAVATVAQLPLDDDSMPEEVPAHAVVQRVVHLLAAARGGRRALTDAEQALGSACAVREQHQRELKEARESLALARAANARMTTPGHDDPLHRFNDWLKKGEAMQEALDAALAEATKRRQKRYGAAVQQAVVALATCIAEAPEL